MTIKNLVFQGGGVKGMAYVGAIDELEKRDVLRGVTCVAGTSAGAITAALLAVGAGAEEVGRVLRGTDFTSFMDGGGWVVRESIRLFNDYGIHPGKAFETWLRAQIADLTEVVTGRAQPDITFGDLRALAAEHPGRARKLYVVSTNLTKQVAEVFSAEAHADVPIYQAVRMSMSIPLFFEAYPFRGDLYVDGGVSWNYPIDLFDGTHRRPVLGLLGKAIGINPGTLGFSLGTKEQIESARHDWRPLPARVDSLESYVKALTSFVLDTSTLLHLDNAAIQRTVFIDNANIPTTDFEIAPAQMDVLIENGAAATRRWFEAHPLANFYRRRPDRG
ncbi:patatin-like phospholipase family protein [Sorangium sp. So ce136]|uniref:patatin-like phospholipase family protein n=1 Tax=Sorangium sp. So ce136 TaxID=3133284 RepID=UPI003F0EE5C2